MSDRLSELSDALVNADKAGDTAGAQALAEEITRLRSAPSLASSMQKRMGVGKTGDTMGSMMKARSDAIYDLGGAVTDATGSPALGAAANVAGDFATDPLTYIGAGVGRLARPLAEASGRALMQKALKPTVTDLLRGKADRAAQTMLDEGINVTRGGVEKLRTMGKDLNDSVDAIVKQASANGATVDKNAVASRLQDEIAKIEKSDWTPQGGRAAVEKVYDEFMSNPLVPKDIPLEQAQRLKQGIYKKLKDQYGALGSETVEANKAGARGFKEDIEAAAPSVAPLNAKASEIWNALNVAERRALMAGNNQVGGITWLAHNPWAWGAAMADRSSFAQSILARALHNGVAPTSTGIGAAAGGGIGNILQGNQQQ